MMKIKNTILIASILSACPILFASSSSESNTHPFYKATVSGFLPENPIEADTVERTRIAINRDIDTLKRFDSKTGVLIYVHMRMQKLSEVERALIAFSSKVKAEKSRPTLFRRMDFVMNDRNTVENLLSQEDTGGKKAFTEWRGAVISAYTDYSVSLVHTERLFAWDAKAAIQNTLADPDRYPELAELQVLSNDIMAINNFGDNEVAQLMGFVEERLTTLMAAHENLRRSVVTGEDSQEGGQDEHHLAGLFEAADNSRYKVRKQLLGIGATSMSNFITSRAELASQFSSYAGSVYRIQAEADADLTSLAVVE